VDKNLKRSALKQALRFFIFFYPKLFLSLRSQIIEKL
jgi:hypothetical protein